MTSTNPRLMKKLSRKERTDLWLRLRKEDEVFIDLCNERDKIARIIEQHQIVNDALISELKNWDIKVEKMFRKLVDKEIKRKSKR